MSNRRRCACADLFRKPASILAQAGIDGAAGG
jgi:hypothetical protein